jgi:hypothetical protein
MKHTSLYKLFFLIALFTFSSCGAIIKSYIRKDTENVPPDLGKEKTTILVIAENNSYTKKIAKIFKENYSGDYLFATRQEADNKYKDLIRYRYILDDDIDITRSKVTTTTKNVKTGISTKSSETRSSASRSFHIFDRKENKIFDTGISSGTYWKTILKTYLAKLEAARKENGGK